MSDNTSYSPGNLFVRLNRLERCLVCVALAAAVAVVTAANWGRTGLFEFVNAYVTVFFMLWLSITDSKNFVLPNKILLAWFACSLLLISLTALSDGSLDVVISSAAGAIITGALFLAVYYLSKRTLGGGDVKLSFVMGLSLTLERVMNAVFYGLIFCVVFALAGLALKKLKRKDVLPLGPFLFAGTLAAYLVQIGG